MRDNENSGNHRPSSQKKGKTGSAASKSPQNVKADKSAADLGEPNAESASNSKISNAAAEEIVRQELAKQGIANKGLAKPVDSNPELAKAKKSQPEISKPEESMSEKTKPAITNPETTAEPDEDSQIVDHYSSQCLRVWPD